MTVSSTQSYVTYNCDGSTKVFAAPFYFLLGSDIAVSVSDAAGNVTDLVHNTNYSVTGQGVASGGTVTLSVAYPSGYQLLIQRAPPQTQETKYYENGKFPAKSHETALDKLTMLIQRFGYNFDNLALKKPNFFARYFDAKNNRIANLADPVQPLDAVNQRFVVSEITKAVVASSVDMGSLSDTSSLALGDALIGVKQPYAGAVARTQHDKNAERITPADFGATGSGADETSYFTALEAVISGQVIDLLGKTYTVTAEPVKNRYINGAFRLTQIIKYNGVDYSYQWNKRREKVSAISPGVSLLRDARTSMARNVFSFSQLTAVQGVCISEVSKQLYTLGLTTDSGGNEVSFVTLFSTASRGTLSAAGASAPNAILGHQGISLEYLSNGTRLWASVRYNSANYPDAGRQVVRFSYSGTDGDAIANIQIYTLFGAEFNASYKENNCLPSVSYDGRFLVAYGRKNTRDVWIRVFDLKMLIDGGAGDYSDKFIYEFNTNQEILSDDDNSAFTPIQAMACDGAYVYLLAGTSSSAATKKIYAYTIDGVFSGKNDNISLGSVGGSLEPEGIFVYRPDYSAPPCLAVHYINGTSAARVNNVWALGYRNPVVTNYTLRGVGSESPQADWHVSRQSSPATVASVSANAMQIIQNDSGNIFLPHVCSSTDGTIVEFDAGPASDYRNGRLTYTYNATNPYWAVWVNNTSMMYFQNNAGVLSIRPGADNTTSLGTSANRWSNVYAATATINTSDERLKLRLDIEDAEKAAALELKANLWKYQFKDANALKEDGGRYHFGIGAQSVGEILTSHGLDPDQYAFYCYDKWDAQYEPVMAVRTVTDPDTGEETEETYDTGETTCVLEAGDRYGVRYEELLCFIMAAL